MDLNNVQVIDNRIFLVGETNLMKIHVDTNVVTAPKSILTVTKPSTIEWKVPKPHINYMYEFIKRASYIYNLYKSEMEIFMLWDFKNKKHNMFIPEQTVSRDTVKFEWHIPKDHALMFELHSHHTMGISFSGTDVATDSSLDILPHISAVLKSVDKFDMTNPDKNIDIRLSYLGNKISLKLSDLFEEETYNMPQVKKEIIVASPVVSMGYNMSNNWGNRPSLENALTDEDYLRKYPAYKNVKSTIERPEYIQNKLPETSEDILDFVNKQLETSKK